MIVSRQTGSSVASRSLGNRRTSEAIASLRRATKLSVRGALRPSAQEGRRPGCMGGASAVVLVIVVLAILYLLRA